jgi:hypothetical protein
MKDPTSLRLAATLQTAVKKMPAAFAEICAMADGVKRGVVISLQTLNH